MIQTWIRNGSVSCSEKKQDTDVFSEMFLYIRSDILKKGISKDTSSNIDLETQKPLR